MDKKYDITNHPNYQYHGQAPVVDNGKTHQKKENIGLIWNRLTSTKCDRNGITKTSKNKKRL